MHEVQEKSEPSKRELHNQAKALNIQGRSKMNKDELVKAIRDAQS
ncbi:Rho termination factor N-terminal domain-containing protein [Nostoc calcicola FACHB-3891]|nr:Rho termination factor N-terminal domain-containing protein [Nostoc calcicola FACHB-3891]